MATTAHGRARWGGRATRAMTAITVGVLLIAAAPPAHALDELAERQHQPMAVDLFAMVNAEREERGGQALAWDSDLARVAADWSARMHDEGFFAHRDLDTILGAQPFASRYRGVAENIAFQRGVPADGATVTDLHVALMESDGHRVNILRERYDTVGIGVSCDQDGGLTTVHVTQVFGDLAADPSHTASTPLNRPATGPGRATGPGHASASHAAPATDTSEAVPPVEPIVGDERVEAVSCDDVDVLGVVDQGVTDDPIREPDHDQSEDDASDAADPPGGQEPGLQRIEGPDRVATSLAVARDRFDADEVTDVVLARSDDYADALAAAPLAGALGGPVLLTDGEALSEGSSPETGVAGTLDHLDVERVWLMGGPGALSEALADEVADHVDHVERVAGANRWETAARAAEHLVREAPSPARHAYVANGDTGWPDAVAVAALAAHEQAPLLLAGQEDAAVAVEALETLDLERAHLIGGDGVLGSQVESAADDATTAPVDRTAGATRWETADALTLASIDAGLDAPRAWLVTLGNWPDSLAVGPAAAAAGEPVAFVDGTDGSPLGSGVAASLSGIDEVTVVGGPNAISEDAAAQAREALR